MILKINDRFKNRQVKFFTDVSVEMKYSSLASTFQLSYFFDPDNIEHREFSCVSHYHECQLIDEETNFVILTGYILSIEFTDAPEKQLVKISGYSLTGVLEDCDIAPTVPEKFRGRSSRPYALQFYGLSLRDIVESIIEPFGLRIIIDDTVQADMASAYEETEIKENQSIKSFLTNLASQKNIIITHDRFGRVIFKRPPSGGAVKFKFTGSAGNATGVTKMVMRFNGQSMHSQITVMKQSGITSDEFAQQDTIFNPYVTTVFRPKVDKITQKGKEDEDAIKAARNSRAKELRSLSLSIEMDRWVVNNHVIMPGDNITVENRNVYLYNKSKWTVEEIVLSEKPDNKTAILKCCLPEVLSGEDPVYIFKGINTHPID